MHQNHAHIILIEMMVIINVQLINVLKKEDSMKINTIQMNIIV